MVDLFRYIEHAFAVPAPTSSVDVVNDSRFQSDLRSAAAGESPYSAVRAVAREFLSSTFTGPVDDPAHYSAQLRTFRDKLDSLDPVTTETVVDLVYSVFQVPASQLVASEQFYSDKVVLQNSVVAVKIVTGFDRANAAQLVRELQVVVLIEEVAGEDPPELDACLLQALLARPVRIPAEWLIAPPAPSTSPGSGGTTSDGGPLTALSEQRDRLLATYRALMALQPAQLEIVDASGGRSGVPQHGATPAKQLRITAAARAAMPAGLQEVLHGLPLEAATASLPAVVNAVKQQLSQADQQLLPATVPQPARVYRVGLNLFTVSDVTPMQALLASAQEVSTNLPPLDFGRAITRPVGYGDLLVVRQELIGYVPGDISHIENVLEGESLTRSTHREEISELTVTEETTTSQSQERDQQSTTRNELSAETQQESGSQTSTSADLTNSSSYGKLVENSKTNYAQSVTAKAVDSVSSMVKQQRVQREKKTYVEDAVHELDNKAGTEKIRGIYQWVDKKYSLRVLNYGKRLLYDVVVPEPAAFLIQSLRDAIQPETFQLTKPVDPGLVPGDLSESNYGYYASVYGVTGSVTPPPDEFTQTVAHTEAPQSFDQKQVLDDPNYHVNYFAAYSVSVPANYKAVSGYLQRVNEEFINPPPGRYLEIFIGESTFFRFDPSVPQLNESFVMNGETGDIPVTVRSFDKIVQMAYAVGINCQRTDKAYEQWQLKTHAQIMSGYQRQLADYQDKLGRYVAAVRSQMALAGNFAHDPTIERDELKKAFIYLLLGEHWGVYPPTPTPAPVPPDGFPPDPQEVKQWGAVVAFFERAFEWDEIMYTFYPYFWGRPQRWSEMILTQDTDPQFEAFLKAGAARVVIPVRPGFEAAMAHYHETGDVWLGEEIPDMYSDHYVSIIAEIKAANSAPGQETCVDHWEVTLPTTLVMLKEDAQLPSWPPTSC